MTGDTLDETNARQRTGDLYTDTKIDAEQIDARIDRRSVVRRMIARVPQAVDRAAKVLAARVLTAKTRRTISKLVAHTTAVVGSE